MGTLNVVNLDKRKRMPRLNQGAHPAQLIVYRYRQEAIEAILMAHGMITRPLDMSGESFDDLALVMENGAKLIRRYRQAELAGDGE